VFFTKAGNGQRRNIDGVRFAVENLFRQQQSDAGGVLEAVAAETVRQNKARRVRMAAQNRMRVRRGLVTSGP
jgi:hypothetical protein